MQVNYPVWKDELNIDRRKLFQVDYNIELGLTILKGYLRGNPRRHHPGPDPLQ